MRARPYLAALAAASCLSLLAGCGSGSGSGSGSAKPTAKPKATLTKEAVDKIVAAAESNSLECMDFTGEVRLTTCQSDNPYDPQFYAIYGDDDGVESIYVETKDEGTSVGSLYRAVRTEVLGSLSAEQADAILQGDKTTELSGAAVKGGDVAVIAKDKTTAEADPPQFPQIDADAIQQSLTAAGYSCKPDAQSSTVCGDKSITVTVGPVAGPQSPVVLGANWSNSHEPGMSLLSFLGEIDQQPQAEAAQLLQQCAEVCAEPRMRFITQGGLLIDVYPISSMVLSISPLPPIEDMG